MTKEASHSTPKNILLGYRFDSLLVFGIPLLAMFTIIILAHFPDLLPLIIVINTHALGLHHVIATYTRLAWRKEDFVKHRFLVIELPIIVLAATLLTGYIGGTIAITTIYFFWQAYHYTRQSYGISRQYNWCHVHSTPLTHAYPMYAVALTGVAYRCFQQHETFLFNPIFMPEVPFLAVQLMGAVALTLVLNQCIFIAKHWQYYQNKTFYLGYILSHYLVFTIAYLTIHDLTIGWLMINIWHNAQYIAFVWYANHKKFTKHPDTSMISRFSQVGFTNIVIYFLICLVMTSIFYQCVDIIIGLIKTHSDSMLPLFLIGYMTINFHHYIVDSIIWKKGK